MARALLSIVVHRLRCSLRRDITPPPRREAHLASRHVYRNGVWLVFSGSIVLIHDVLHARGRMMYTRASDLAAWCADSWRDEPLLTRSSLSS